MENKNDKTQDGRGPGFCIVICMTIVICTILMIALVVDARNVQDRENIDVTATTAEEITVIEDNNKWAVASCSVNMRDADWEKIVYI